MGWLGAALMLPLLAAFFLGVPWLGHIAHPQLEARFGERRAAWLTLGLMALAAILIIALIQLVPGMPNDRPIFGDDG